MFEGIPSQCNCHKVLSGSIFRDLEAAFGNPSSQSMHETVHLTINRPLAPWLRPVPSSKECHHRGLRSYAMTCDIQSLASPTAVPLESVWKHFLGDVGGCGVGKLGSLLQNPFSISSYHPTVIKECEILYAGSKESFCANS